MVKKQSERIHFKHRINERYGMEINRFDCREIIYKIQNGEYRFVARLSKNRRECIVEHAGRKIRLIYDKIRNELITALPPIEQEQ
jgi:hypothetical protein